MSSATAHGCEPPTIIVGDIPSATAPATLASRPSTNAARLVAHTEVKVPSPAAGVAAATTAPL